MPSPSFADHVKPDMIVRNFNCLPVFSLARLSEYGVDTIVTPCGVKRSTRDSHFVRTRLHCACSGSDSATSQLVHQVLLIIDGIARLRSCIHDDALFFLNFQENLTRDFQDVYKYEKTLKRLYIYGMYILYAGDVHSMKRD